MPTAELRSNSGNLSRIERLREQAGRCARAERLVTHLGAACDDADVALAESLAARQAQQVSWLVLCDRGWPSDISVDTLDVRLAQEWLAEWHDLVTLPMRISSARDLVNLRRIRRRLERCEAALRPELPASLWNIIDPLDDTGRATLACVLQAFQGWLDANVRCELTSRAKERLVVRFTLFSHQAATLGLTPPQALLDVDAWRTIASAARRMADEVRRAPAA